MKITFLDHYDSFSYNLIDWLVGKNDSKIDVQHIFCDDYVGLELWQKSPKTPLVLSPGPKTPLDYPKSLEIIKNYQGEIPIFGVCLGHQLIAAANQATIIRGQKPMHGSVRTISMMKEHVLARKMPCEFPATSYNSLVIKEDSLDSSWVFAKNQLGEIEGILRPEGQWCTLGVQFHPESFLSEKQEFLKALFIDEVRGFYSVSTAYKSLGQESYNSAEAPLSMPS